MAQSIDTVPSGSSVSTVIIGAGIGSGIVLGIFKQKGFWGTFGYAALFGAAGLVVAVVVDQFN
jgi:hypothetical protein